MDRLACMQSFVRAIELNSFSAVARERQTTQPAISKQISALEKHLGVQLLQRSTTGLNLTEEGKQYFLKCRQILETLAEAEANLTQSEKPCGVLRVGCPVLFGQMQIVPRLPAFFQRYPQIKLDLVMVDSFVDLVEEGLDLCIRIGDRLESHLVAERLGITRRVTVATGQYFERVGEPQTPADLVDCDCIVYTRLSSVNEWHFQGAEGLIKVRVGGAFQTNSSIGVRTAVLAGLGIALAPVWMFGEEIYRGDLRVVLQSFQPTTLPIYAVYPRSRFYPPKLLAFRDFLAGEFRLDPWVSDYGAPEPR